MTVQITTGVILATVAILGLVITVTKATNRRFKETENDLSSLRLTYTERAAKTETELASMKTLQETHGKELLSVGKNVAWLVKWARNGGTK